MLNNASTRSGAGGTQVRGNINAETGLVGVVRGRSGCEAVPVDQGSANDGVFSSVDDRHICSSGVRSANVELHGDDLTSGICLDIVLVVIIFETFAEPDIALCGIVVGLSGGDLKFTLNIAIVVTLLVVTNLLSASGDETGQESDGASPWLLSIRLTHLQAYGEQEK